MTKANAIAKTTTTTEPDTDHNVEPTAELTEIPMRVLKLGSASSLSNRSTLGYAIGCDESKAIHLSLRSNTASGMFSKNWVAFLDIAELVTGADKITSSTLQPLYANTSNNNAGFMAAVLLSEELIGPGTDRGYQCLDFKPFLNRINALITSGVDLGDADAPVEVPEVIATVAKRGKQKKA